MTQALNHLTDLTILLSNASNPRDEYLITHVYTCIHCIRVIIYYFIRLEHSIVIGQSSSILVNIKGDHLSRKVTYHAHASNGVKVCAHAEHAHYMHMYACILT